jgi:hypothetical protein
MADRSYVKADEIQIKGYQIFSLARGKWLPLTPEERVRQEYLFILTSEFRTQSRSRKEIKAGQG